MASETAKEFTWWTIPTDTSSGTIQGPQGAIDQLQRDAKYGRALRRLEAWEAEDEDHRSVSTSFDGEVHHVELHDASGYTPELPYSSMVTTRSAPDLAAAIHAALDAWEAGA